MLAFVLLLSAFSDDDSNDAPIPTIAPAPTVSETPSPRRLPTFDEGVVDLDGLPTPNGTSYLVFFYSERCERCVEFAGGWARIAEVGAGLITFAALNCDKYPRDCQYHAVVPEEPSIYLLDGNGSVQQIPIEQDVRYLLDLLCSRVPSKYVIVDRYNYTVNAEEKGAFLFLKGTSMAKLWTAVQSLLNRTDIVFYASVDKGLYEDLGLPKFPGIYAIRKGEFILYDKEPMPRDIADFLTGIFPVEQAPAQPGSEADYEL
jgi:hypothetical protein